MLSNSFQHFAIQMPNYLELLFFRISNSSMISPQAMNCMKCPYTLEGITELNNIIKYNSDNNFVL